MRSWPIAVLLVAAQSVVPGPACASVQEPQEPAKIVTPRDVTQSPERYGGVEVTISGKLISEGNYFSRSRKVYLVGESGDRLEVKPWVPLSSPPPRNASDKQPETLADYLDQQVELRGVLRSTKATVPPANAPATIVLDVKSAKILKR
jgi:hypothetical protein